MKSGHCIAFLSSCSVYLSLCLYSFAAFNIAKLYIYQRTVQPLICNVTECVDGQLRYCSENICSESPWWNSECPSTVQCYSTADGLVLHPKDWTVPIIVWSFLCGFMTAVTTVIIRCNVHNENENGKSRLRMV